MRNIFIIGLGNFGFYLAAKLEGKSHVTAIDIDRDKIQRIGPMVARAVVGDATNRELLRELGIDSAEVAVVSVGESMENFGIIEVDAPDKFAGHSLADLSLRSEYGVTAIGIFRKGDRLVNPAPETIILKGDRMVLLGNEEDIVEFEDSLR
ncbi:MAG: NAD-binding protein [Acidobacteriota bacterium]